MAWNRTAVDARGSASHDGCGPGARGGRGMRFSFVPSPTLSDRTFYQPQWRMIDDRQVSIPVTKLRYAMVGVGASILSEHKLGLLQPTVQIVGVTDVNRRSGSPSAELGASFFGDHRSMLAAVHPDVTVILTPHPYHAEIAIEALDAGSHVLVEKPMAVEVAEADAMIAAADRNHRLLAVNFQQRHRPEVKTAHKLIASGRLGDIVRVELVEPWMRPAAYYRSAGWRGTWRGEGGGVLLNQAPHGLDLVCHLAGLPIEVYAWTRRCDMPSRRKIRCWR